MSLIRRLRCRLFGHPGWRYSRPLDAVVCQRCGRSEKLSPWLQRLS